MTSKKLQSCIIIALFLLLCVSIWKNVDYAAQKKRMNKWILSAAYTNLMNISDDLDYVLEKTNDQPIDYEVCAFQLNKISRELSELHAVLKSYDLMFPSAYSGMDNFSKLAYTLASGSGEANGRKYSGVQADHSISKDEILYLTALKESVDHLLRSFASEESGVQVDYKLTAHQIRGILNSFFEEWTWNNRNRDNPLWLLCN